MADAPRTLAERKALLRRLPWVKELQEPTTCDGIKWSQVAVRDLYGTETRPARGIQDRARCKLTARYRFTSLKRSRATDGNYCFTHVVQQISHHEEETARLRRWMEGH